jgi:hypothetical protein
MRCGAAADEDRVIGRFDDAAVVGIEKRQFFKPKREIY